MQAIMVFGKSWYDLSRGFGAMLYIVVHCWKGLNIRVYLIMVRIAAHVCFQNFSLLGGALRAQP